MIFNRTNCFFFFITIIFIGFNNPSFSQKATKAQTGTASWYGSKYHGRKTSSGERYNRFEMTAAHKKLPFGTKVKVTNLDNNKSVIVRINDRGPFVGNRIIDVSEAAARVLDIRGAGLGEVKVEILGKPGSALASLDDEEQEVNEELYTIEAGSFLQPQFAKAFSEKLKAFDKHLSIELSEEQFNGMTIHRIKAGRFENKQQAEAFNDLLAEEGLNGTVSAA
ncbi:septal ring lytic transglycosylase RlpA family protein [Pontibacter qinzhouensis]|uniref:Probable endolytic peptidoglycan transglycosylase RlpA n=1 Tax=Pontibacter qinzhouensis TaxID=2603253 RepID=A0A5C8KCN3_9BACT|nr:septal ring lytic transglycosylase RlpA family protein [Pontibacter qinzhouensis]TXK51984.1 septal ring lytic transglycosylase RlpA family protein [Pontibacter qinzhouensis]